jgi:hypothetical protein
MLKRLLPGGQNGNMKYRCVPKPDINLASTYNQFSKPSISLKAETIAATTGHLT